MSKNSIFTLILLLALTIVAGLVSGQSFRFVVPVILLLAAVKFIGVAFAFMEMQQSNLFWRALIVGYVAVFTGMILLLL